MPLCACCGFKSEKGVLSGHHAANGLHREFTCERCFSNPFLFNEAKWDVSRYLLNVHCSEVPNRFANKHNGISTATMAVYSSRKSKRELAVIGDLYVGQRQLCRFEEAL